ncbi:NAD(P)H-dependent flavin oxidoreductase [Effusibacillus lacus]|uniref:Probable nitronate monooxygenase n=1 Tax=Effusibacillus lacus TaxID=1348429 RepID=A0A292YIY5_9BACL|nr:nitronate monooxygenase [Effusibacillus lacus]TCS74555.1 2-nitropropane dioxygenase precursor [Effusibacillus lacus]GAX88430.1 nitronate monooxygenase [Effusibacillus lacus]
MRTRITDLLGIQYPILCGGMFRVGRAPLAAAVSEAGGLGIITSATFETAEELRQEIRLAAELTKKPIGININLFPSVRKIPNEAYIEVLLEEGIRIVETSGRNPEAFMKILKDNGVIVIHKVPGVRYAQTAERVGCDAVAVVGFETGGHPGMEDVGHIVLVPRTVNAVKIPVLAGGGIADGRGLAAALALGAEGVVLGTRFLATKESMVHPNVKQWMVEASELDTALIQKSIGSVSRVARNAVALEVMEAEKNSATLEELLPLIKGERSVRVYTEGDVDAGVWSCGQSVGLIYDVPTVKEVVDRMVREAKQAIERMNEIIR